MKTLDISGTDINSGLEYLPESLEKSFCDDRQRSKAEVNELLRFLRGFYKDDHPYMYGYYKWLNEGKQM